MWTDYNPFHLSSIYIQSIQHPIHPFTTPKCDCVFVRSSGKQVKLGDLGLATHGNFRKKLKGTLGFIVFRAYYNEE